MKLSPEAYRKIKIIIADVLEDYEITSIPIDIFDLARKMKIKVVLASEIVKKHPEKKEHFKQLEYPESLKLYDPKTDRFVIYINDLRAPKCRQRFSLAHEIIHIILGHKEQSELNEAEANFGARYLLLPASLVLEPEFNLDAVEPRHIAWIFDVSEPVAINAMDAWRSRLSQITLQPQEYECRINYQLLGSFKQKLRTLGLMNGDSYFNSSQPMTSMRPVLLPINKVFLTKYEKKEDK